MLEGKGSVGIFLRTCRRKFGESDCGKIGRLPLEIFQDARDGKARDVAGLLKAGEFGFFDGGEEGVIVEESSGRIAAKFGEAEDAHQARAFTWKPP